jgi:ribosome-binding factor A
MTKRSGSARDFPRTARLNHLVHEIVAEEIELLDDERLGFLTVVGVEVESDLRRATVWYTILGEADTGAGGNAAGDAAGDAAGALEEHRGRLQAAIARQARLKRTPELVFRPDTVIVQAQRVEDILRDLYTEPGPGAG